jgi:hypothetical protein
MAYMDAQIMAEYGRMRSKILLFSLYIECWVLFKEIRRERSYVSR